MVTFIDADRIDDQAALDQAADDAWTRMQDCPHTHPDYPLLRMLAFAKKDVADAYAHADIPGWPMSSRIAAQTDPWDAS